MSPDRVLPHTAPIERLDQFMARANARYYATHDPFADFATSPQISQIFGEVLGLWCGVVWQGLGEPDRISLIEAGPGSGALMTDALRALRTTLPRMLPALDVHFIETTPHLIAGLRRRFPDATIHPDLASMPDYDRPLLLLANEFLDALPIRQFVRSPNPAAWLERHVQAGQPLDLPITQAEQIQLAPWAEQTNPGAIREINNGARDFIAALATRIAQRGGAGLLIDYGPLASGPGDTLQAISQGQPADPLSDPGHADLTAHVDFAALATIARAKGCVVAGPIAQGQFLAALGIHQRTAALGRHATPNQAANLLAATRRLTAAEAMGELFKAFAIAPNTLLPLPGFPA